MIRKFLRISYIWIYKLNKRFNNPVMHNPDATKIALANQIDLNNYQVKLIISDTIYRLKSKSVDEEEYNFMIEKLQNADSILRNSINNTNVLLQLEKDSFVTIKPFYIDSKNSISVN